jgi:hypothetical protein
MVKQEGIERKGGVFDSHRRRHRRRRREPMGVGCLWNGVW